MFYVSTSGGGVKKISSDGSEVADIATYPGPGGLAVDGSGNVFVADGASSIFRITSNGSSSVFASGLPANIGGLAFDANGLLYAASNSTHSQVGTIFDGAFHPLTITGGFEPAYSAAGLAFDAAGYLYVTNISQYGSNPNSLLRLAPPALQGGDWEASVVHTFGVNSQPSGVTLDSSGNIYVTLFNEHVIVKLFPNGTIDSSFNPSGLAFPTDIVFAEGNLYVTSLGNFNISQITLDGTVSSFASLGSQGSFITYSAVPEPSALALTALAGAAIWGLHRRKR